MPEAKPSVYVETTIPSYLTAWPSRDLVVATHQQITNVWWRDAKDRFDLFTSQSVLDEATSGDPQAVIERLRSLQGVPVLPPDPRVESVAAEYIDLLKLPPKATTDAVHLAYAVVFEMTYLATWNMRHLANSLTMRRLTEFNTARSMHVPLVVTPEYLLEFVEEDEP